MVGQFHEMELAWAAGFLEGEGHIKVKQTRAKSGNLRSPALAIIVSQNIRARLERFQNALGGVGSVRGPYKKSHVWSTSHNGALKTLELLWPYLGPEFRKRVWILWRECDRESSRPHRAMA
jgi:hypothetical protein